VRAHPGTEPELKTNPHAERFVRTIPTECLDQFVIFDERHLRHSVHEFCAQYYHGERFHQGLGGRRIKPRTSPSNDNATVGPIQCRSRLGGLLDFHQQEAA
jgi:putative transposase